jgi:hypothetical protein
MENMQVACAYVGMYNSQPNVSAAIGNNGVTLMYPTGPSSYSTHELVMPTGFYSAKTSFSSWIKEQLTLLGFDSDSVSVGMNSSLQSLVRLSVASGQTNTPYILLGSTTLVGILGFTYTQLGVANATEQQSVVSDAIPTPHLVSNLELHCNLTQATHSGMSSSFPLAVVPVGSASYGGLLSRTFPQLSWHDIAPNYYRQLEITVRDQDQTLVAPVDLSILIVVSFREKI